MDNRHSTILITGGAGFIGSHFVDLVIEMGKRAIVLDAFTYAGHKENLEHINAPGKFELVRGDINDTPLVSRLLRDHSIEAIVNFAAETHVDRSIEGPKDFIETNIVGTFNLLRSSLNYWEGLKGNLKEAFRFVQVSTDEVFGSLGSKGKFSEESPFQPNSPYSASKAAADHLVHAWNHTYGLPTITTHCSNNYGPRQYPEKLIPYIIRCALDGKDLPLYGDGRNVRDWIHVTDHCRGVWLALTHGKVGRRYCFGGNEEWANIDIIGLVCDELDHLKPLSGGRSYRDSIRFVKDRPGHDRRYAIDAKVAQRELGFQSTHPFRQGIVDTVRWYVANQDWCRRVMNNVQCPSPNDE